MSKWVQYTGYKCSKCGWKVPLETTDHGETVPRYRLHDFAYCPGCGERIDGVEKDFYNTIFGDQDDAHGFTGKRRP